MVWERAGGAGERSAVSAAPCALFPFWGPSARASGERAGRERGRAFPFSNRCSELPLRVGQPCRRQSIPAHRLSALRRPGSGLGSPPLPRVCHPSTRAQVGTLAVPPTWQLGRVSGTLDSPGFPSKVVPREPVETESIDDLAVSWDATQFGNTISGSLGRCLEGSSGTSQELEALGSQHLPGK